MLARSRSIFFLCAIAGIALAASPAHVLGAGLERKVPRQLAEPIAACPTALEHQLPLPSVLGEGKHAEFQKTLLDFLDSRTYQTLNWCVDKGVRDTGPWANGKYTGTHPAVRIFYSPKMMTWLVNGRQGPIPDGALIVKEMFNAPAARYAGQTPTQVNATFARNKFWTVMLKDQAGSKDGWYWGDLATGMALDSYDAPFNVFNASFGTQSCVRCHASADKESTFSALSNITGFPGTPIVFPVDDSWKTMPAAPWPSLESSHGRAVRAARQPLQLDRPPELDAELIRFLKGFPSIPQVPLAAVEKIPNENFDRVVPPANVAPGAQTFVTSDQCQGCHSGLAGTFGPTMFVPTGPTEEYPPKGLHLSPYGEWR